MFIILAFAYVLLGNNFRASKTLPVEVASARNLKVDPKNIDCKVSVPYPADTAPIRSPQEVHSIIATKTLNRTIVEIGTRNGDGMTCFAKFAASASAVEYDEKYCKKLERRATRERVPFEIQCQDFNLADLDADFITWWQQHPLTNLATLARLKQLSAWAKFVQALRQFLYLICNGLVTWKISSSSSHGSLGTRKCSLTSLTCVRNSRHVGTKEAKKLVFRANGPMASLS